MTLCLKSDISCTTNSQIMNLRMSTGKALNKFIQKKTVSLMIQFERFTIVNLMPILQFFSQEQF